MTFEKLKELPSTNYRIYWSVKLAWVYMLGCLLSVVLKSSISNELAWTLGLFIIVLAGIDVAQFASKRFSSEQWHEGRAKVERAKKGTGDGSMPAEPTGDGTGG